MTWQAHTGKSLFILIISNTYQVSQATKKIYKIVLRVHLNLLSLELASSWACFLLSLLSLELELAFSWTFYSKFSQGVWNMCSGRLANFCVVEMTLYSLSIFLTYFLKRQWFKTLALVKLTTFRTVDKNPLRIAGSVFIASRCQFRKQWVTAWCGAPFFTNIAKPCMLPSLTGAPSVLWVTKPFLPS